MNIEQINKILSDYEELISLVKSKVSVLEPLDNEYLTYEGILDISIRNYIFPLITVKCDIGYYEFTTFSFPLDWLTIPDDELEEMVKTDKENRIKKETEELERREQEKQKKEEQREFEKYLALKAKFEC